MGHQKTSHFRNVALLVPSSLALNHFAQAHTQPRVALPLSLRLLDRPDDHILAQGALDRADAPPGVARCLDEPRLDQGVRVWLSAQAAEEQRRGGIGISQVKV